MRSSVDEPTARQLSENCLSSAAVGLRRCRRIHFLVAFFILELAYEYLDRIMENGTRFVSFVIRGLAGRGGER